MVTSGQATSILGHLDLRTEQRRLNLLRREAAFPVTKPPRELGEFLFRYDPAIQSLALGLRTIVHDEMAGCHEYIFEMRSKVVLLFGATERVIADGICNIGVFRRHVTLGFPRGADLDDPAGALQGAGKAMRHLALAKLSDLDRPEIRAFLRKARKHAGLKRRSQGMTDHVVTRVKQKSARATPAWPQMFPSRRRLRD
jgi:Domain of unknown function (DU1801)